MFFLASADPEKTEQAADESSHYMGELGNRAAWFAEVSKGVEELSAQIKNQYQNKRKGNFSLIEVGKRSQEYHHKNNAACAKKVGRKEEYIKYPRNQGGDEDHD